MKICLWYEDNLYEYGAFLNPEYGNNGMAGTQYQYAMLMKYLLKNYQDYELYVCHTCPNKLLPGVFSYIYDNVYSALEYIKKQNINLVLYTAGQSTEWYTLINQFDYDVPFIAWDHNYLSYRELTDLNYCNKIKRIVCCSKELYETYVDHSLFKKMTYIFNMVNEDAFEKRNENVKNIVTYMGFLGKQKGFHILAKSWKKILNKVPDAELYVAGNGQLYNKNWKLGKYGLAEQSYEDEFIPYLLDNKGKLLNSVHFLGNIGIVEKKELLSKTKVGVPNPSAKTETYCIVATEFQSAGVPVVTRGEYGLCDTVSDGKTGLFSNSQIKLENNITKLLINNELNIRLSNNCKQFIKEKFDPEKLIQQWDKLFKEVNNNIENINLPVTGPMKNHYKWLRVINSNIKKIPGFNKLPSILYWTEKVKRK